MLAYLIVQSINGEVIHLKIDTSHTVSWTAVQMMNLAELWLSDDVT